MSGFLLDTNVLSEFNRRGEPDRLVKQWLEAADTDSLYARSSPSEKSDWESSFFLQVSGVRSWSSGLNGTCTSGLKAEFCRSMNRLQIGGGPFAPKRS